MFNDRFAIFRLKATILQLYGKDEKKQKWPAKKLMSHWCVNSVVIFTCQYSSIIEFITASNTYRSSWYLWACSSAFSVLKINMDRKFRKQKNILKIISDWIIQKLTCREMKSKHRENLCHRTQALYPESNCNVKCRQRKMTDLQLCSQYYILWLRKCILFSKHITYFVIYFHWIPEISCHLTKGQDLGI